MDEAVGNITEAFSQAGFVCYFLFAEKDVFSYITIHVAVYHGMEHFHCNGLSKLLS